MAESKPEVQPASKPDSGFGSEKHWGDPNRSQVREVFYAGEVSGALVWLSAAAVVSLILEVVFLGAWVHIGSLAVPVPWTIPVAYIANLIITNTALLWTQERAKAAVPVIAWTVGFAVLLFWSAMPFGGDMVLGQWLRTVVLLAAGVIGGVWPLRRVRSCSGL